MMIYTVANQKGGVGKSTTAAALWAGLNRAGHKSLVIDLDPQCNLTFTTAADTNHRSALGLLTGEADPLDTIQTTEEGDVIAGSKALVGADNFITTTGKEYRLREALEQIKARYDHIVIDCPPALGILTVNALTAATHVIIPCQADIFSLQGVQQLSQTIDPVRKYCNPALHIEGLLLTRYNARTALSRDISEIMQQLAQKLGTKLFTTTIREGIAVKEAQLSQRTLFDYAPKAKVTDDYRAFIDELLKGEQPK